MNTTVVLMCNCAHIYQDEKYGNRKRLHNKKKGGFEARCTVCKTINRVLNLNSK